MLKLAPSILSADFANLERDIRILNDTEADLVHIDIMDGSFVPVITFGSQVVSAIRSYTDKPFDVHLMIHNPDRHINSFVKAGADIITVHVEACPHLHRTVQNIKSHGIKAGVVLNPATSLSVVEYILQDIDMVLLMTVNPGYGGQSYINSVTPKIEKLRKMITEKNLSVDIEIDGGINLKNVKSVIQAGANVFVAGSAIFNGDIYDNVHKFKTLFREVEE